MDTEVKVPTVKFQWSKASDVEIEQYRMKSYMDLGIIIIPEAVKSTNNHYDCHEHQKQLDSYYDNISNDYDYDYEIDLFGHIIKKHNKGHKQ